MKLEQYLALDREQLAVVLANPKRDHELAMLLTMRALKANTIEPRKLPAFTQADGKIVQPEKKIVKCKTYRANI
jgi:hypothetical protein